MNKNYISPKAEIKSFACEDVITASGVNVTPNPNPLAVLQAKNFANSDANVSWKDIVR